MSDLRHYTLDDLEIAEETAKRTTGRNFSERLAREWPFVLAYIGFLAIAMYGAIHLDKLLHLL